MIFSACCARNSLYRFNRFRPALHCIAIYCVVYCTMHTAHKTFAKITAGWLF